MNRENDEVDFHVDLIRTVAIFLVILMHTVIEPHPVATQIDQSEIIRWVSVTVYYALSQPAVPLFVMLSGALLLHSSKIEPLSVFLKKRVNRIALPFVFWSIIYFMWRQFVNGEDLTLKLIFHGIETGPYYHMWFIYMIVGLYLITPLLRVLMANAERKLIKYALILWFIGTAITPILWLLEINVLNSNLFLVAGWTGYFILGNYLLQVKKTKKFLYIALFTGFLLTIMGTFLVSYFVGGDKSNFFFDALGGNIILASVSLFLLLQKVSPEKLQSRFPQLDSLIHVIGQNSLPIYLCHIIVLETLQRGYLGFSLSLNTLSPVYEVPLLAVITLFVSLGLVLLLKRIPLLEKLIG